MNDPKISIIVPIYNGENYISSFFNCISSQKYQNYEVLFIDDGSSDNTFDLCQKLTCRDQRIKIFRKKNGGPSSARNYGITHAEGEYLVFFDIDDEFSEDILFDNTK